MKRKLLFKHCRRLEKNLNFFPVKMDNLDMSVDKTLVRSKLYYFPVCKEESTI